MMHKALHHRDDMDRLYASRKEGGRGRISIEDSINTLIRHLEDYIKRTKKDWLQWSEKTLIAPQGSIEQQ